MTTNLYAENDNKKRVLYRERYRQPHYITGLQLFTLATLVGSVIVANLSTEDALEWFAFTVGFLLASLIITAILTIRELEHWIDKQIKENVGRIQDDK